MSFRHLAAAAAICAGLFGAGNAAAVTGDSIYGAWQVNIFANDYQSFGTKVVGSGVEFTEADTTQPITADFSEYYVKLTFGQYIGFNGTSTMTFNGFVFTDLTSNFSGHTYQIESSGTTVPNFTDAMFEQTGNSLRFNFARLQMAPGDTILLRAVPEPETYAMLLGGLGLIGWMSRRKQRRSARA